MKSIALRASIALFTVSQAKAQPMTNAPPAPAPIVFFDIAGPDAAGLKAFYAANLGWSIDGANASRRRSWTEPCGRIRRKPRSISASPTSPPPRRLSPRRRVTVLPRTVAPNVPPFARFKDPAGNRMGLVEIKAA